MGRVQGYSYLLVAPLSVVNRQVAPLSSETSTVARPLPLSLASICMMYAVPAGRVALAVGWAMATSGGVRSTRTMTGVDSAWLPALSVARAKMSYSPSDGSVQA